MIALLIAKLIVAVSLNAAAWDIRYSSGMPKHPSPLKGGGWYFDFPRYDGGQACYTDWASCHVIGYLTTKYTSPISASSVSMKLNIPAQGSVVFKYDTDGGNTCDSPAKVRFYLERLNTDFSGNGKSEFHRWWSNPVAFQLAASGVVTVTATLTPDQWSSVYGKAGNLDTDSLAGFQDVLKNPGNIGITFGGGCFFAHGVYVSAGNAQFQLLNYWIQ